MKSLISRQCRISRFTSARRVIAAIFCCLLLLHQSAAGQSSAASISFQGVLNGANGQPLPNGSYDLTFRFYSNAVGGVSLGTAPVSGVAVAGGVASTAIPVQPGWFDGSTCYLGITVAGQNGGNELLPRVLVTAVPYAILVGTLLSQTGTTDFSRLVVRGPGDNEAVSIQGGGEVPVIDVVKTGGSESAPVLRIFRDYPKNETTALLTVNRNGAIGIGTISPESSLDVHDTTRTNVLQITSARAAKEGFEPVDPTAVLAKVAALQIST